MPIAEYQAKCVVCGQSIDVGQSFELLECDAEICWSHIGCWNKVKTKALVRKNGAWVSGIVTKTPDALSEREIRLTNVGPVRRFSFTVPEGGGVVRLVGDNGSGKSIVLDAVHSLVTGRGTLPTNDKAEKSSIEGLGAVLTVARKATRKGELVFESLDSKFSVADFIDPGLIDEQAADAKRVKSLIGLLGIKSDLSLFFQLTDEHTIRHVAKPKTLKQDDLLDLAVCLKSDFEDAARAAGDAADNLLQRAATREAVAEGVDMEAPDDSSALQDAFAQAVKAHQLLESENNRAMQTAIAAQSARTELASLPPVPAERSAAEFDSRLEGQRDDLAKINEKLATWNAQLIALQRDMEILARERQRVEERIAETEREKSAAAESNRMIEGAIAHRKRLDETIAAEFAPVPWMEMQTAVARVKEAKLALEYGETVRRAKAARKDAEDMRKEALSSRAVEEAQRNVAKGIEGVLSAQIAQSVPGRLQVKKGRLLTPTERSPETPFGELSEGERCRFALEILIPLLKAKNKYPLLVLPQNYWEALQPASQLAIEEAVKGTDVVILTAECADGELHAETGV